LDYFHFKNLRIFDIFDSGYSQLPELKSSHLEIQKVDLLRFFSWDFLEGLSLRNSKNKDLSIILHFNAIG
jgi:hypothetical protein